jgi:hypothetical protein
MESSGLWFQVKGKRYANEKGENYIVLLDGKRYEGGRETEEFTTVKYKEYGILIEKDIPFTFCGRCKSFKNGGKKNNRTHRQLIK